MEIWRLGVVLMVLALPARANDTMAVGAAGGLVFVKSAEVAMESEDLRISAEAIRVRYVFRNRTDRPVEALLAFPLPDLDHAADRQMIPPVETRDGDFVGFSVVADGKAVRPVLVARAFVGATEVTDELKRHGIPLSRHMGGPRIDRVIANLGEAERQALAAAGILGAGEVDDFEPKWTLRTAYTWAQAFPPNRPVTIEHRYRPVTGGDWLHAADLESGRWADYCIDGPAQAALRKRLSDDRAARVTLVEYVLTTGANWAGPIGHFRLTLDKGKPQRLLSTCLDGLERVGPTRWRLEHRGFTPRRDIRVMLVEADERR